MINMNAEKQTKTGAKSIPHLLNIVEIFTPTAIKTLTKMTRAAATKFNSVPKTPAVFCREPKTVRVPFLMAKSVNESSLECSNDDQCHRPRQNDV
uniref:Uncharacterized protein n=1 Tax=Romanomermis culicivorax TaxID=13658 RepID=A0A915HR91_ROMCU